MNDENANVTALDIVFFFFIVFLVVSILVWFFFLMLCNFTEEDGEVWCANDYKVDRDQCKEILRKNKLCFRLEVGDVLKFNETEAKQEGQILDQWSKTSISGAVQIDNGGRSLIIEDDAHISKSVENEQDSVTHDGVCEIHSLGDGADGAIKNVRPENVVNNGYVLRIPIRGNSHSQRFSPSLDCAICLENFKLSDEVAFSHNHECCHIFHLDCLATYTEKKKGAEKPCPCCRQCFLDVPMFLHNEHDDRDLQSVEVRSSSTDESFDPAFCVI